MLILVVVLGLIALVSLGCKGVSARSTPFGRGTRDGSAHHTLPARLTRWQRESGVLYWPSLSLLGRSFGVCRRLAHL